MLRTHHPRWFNRTRLTQELEEGLVCQRAIPVCDPTAEQTHSLRKHLVVVCTVTCEQERSRSSDIHFLQAFVSLLQHLERQPRSVIVLILLLVRMY